MILKDKISALRLVVSSITLILTFVLVIGGSVIAHKITTNDLFHLAQDVGRIEKKVDGITLHYMQLCQRVSRIEGSRKIEK